MSALTPESVPSDDRGLLLGDGLFETIRLYAGRPFRLDRHLARLGEGAGRLGIPLPTDLAERVEEAVRRWGPGDGALRITLTRGSGGIGLVPPDPAEGRLLLSLRPLLAISESSLPTVRARLFGRIDEGALTAGVKGIGYLERIQALRLAREAGSEEALLRNTTGRVVEGSASNLFALVEGSLLAPGLREGALPGITREALLEGAIEMGLRIEERGVAMEALQTASELFLSSSLREVAAVVEVEGRPVGAGVAGAVAYELHRRFRDKVRAELGV